MGFTANTIRVLIIGLYPVVVLVQWLTKLISRKDEEETAVSLDSSSISCEPSEENIPGAHTILLQPITSSLTAFIVWGFCMSPILAAFGCIVSIIVLA